MSRVVAYALIEPAGVGGHSTGQRQTRNELHAAACEGSGPETHIEPVAAAEACRPVRPACAERTAAARQLRPASPIWPCKSHTAPATIVPDQMAIAWHVLRHTYSCGRARVTAGLSTMYALCCPSQTSDSLAVLCSANLDSATPATVTQAQRDSDLALLLTSLGTGAQAWDPLVVLSSGQISQTASARSSQHTDCPLACLR